MDESSSALSQQAISAALACNWEEALKINQTIIELDPKNVDALNRIARAYFELGNFKEARKYYESALKQDPYNQIAAKFLKRIDTFSKQGKKVVLPHNSSQISSDLFIEEPGKTKLVNLLKVAEPQKLSLLSSGILVNLVVKNRGISITDPDNEYLGVLPDDLSHRLIRLIRGGNRYQAIIKTIKTNGLSIMIREIFRSARFRNQPSFLDGLNVKLAYSSDNIIVPDDKDKDDTIFNGEDEESM